MVSVGTVLRVVDNSGAIRVRCIKILGCMRAHSSFGRAGDKLIASVQRALPGRKVKVHDVRLCVLIRQRQNRYRRNGLVLSFSKSVVTLIEPRFCAPICTRIKGPVMSELRAKRLLKVILISNGFV